MSTNYHARHYENLRKMQALLIEEMHPWKINSEDYEKALARLFRSDEEDIRNWRRGTIRTYGTCLECLGVGSVENPAWFDDDECREPEAVDCETCRGAGLVEIVDKPAPEIVEAEEFPF